MTKKLTPYISFLPILLLLFNCSSSTEGSIKDQAEEARFEEETVNEDVPDAVFIDKRDGQSYTCLILKDGRKWMTENLNYQTTNSVYYNNQESKKYGRLYPWNDAVKACPKGWSLPTDEDWMRMIKDYGDALNSLVQDKPERQYEESIVAYEKLKEADFLKVLAGGKKYGSEFGSLDSRAIFWSSTETEGGFITMDGVELKNENGIFYLFNSENSRLYRNSNHKASLYSCRCVEDK